MSVNKADYDSVIDQTARSHRITQEEAWDMILEQLTEEFTEAKRKRGGRAKPASLPAPSEPAQSAANAPAPPPLASVRATRREVAPQIIKDVDGSYVLHLNGSTVASLGADALPAELSRANLSVMELISSGALRLHGEHPDAALLRDAMPSGPGAGDFIHPRRVAAMQQVKQLQYQFPFQRDSIRLLPTDFAKTSLFRVASNASTRRVIADEMLGKVGDSTNIEYRGPELRHDDELVFMQLLHVARGCYPFDYIDIENIPFFLRNSRGVIRTMSQKDYDAIHKSLLRLREALLIVTNTNTGAYFTVNLLAELKGGKGFNKVVIDPTIVLLCASFAAMDTKVLFNTSGVARQLYKYISTIPTSISTLHPIKITSLYELCYGTLESLQAVYKTENPTAAPAKVRTAMSKKVSDFRQVNLPKAIRSLIHAGVIDSISIDPATDKITIMRDAKSTPNVVVGAAKATNE